MSDFGQTIASGQVLANYEKSHGYLFVMNKERTNSLVLGFDLGSTAYPGWTCQAKKGNKRAEKLCLSLGGKNKYESEGCVIGACYEYTL